MRLRVLRVPSPLVRPFITAVRRTDRLDVVLVEATDADGRRGYGEAATSWRVTGESPQSVAAAVAGPLAEAVRGRDAGDPGLAVRHRAVDLGQRRRLQARSSAPSRISPHSRQGVLTRGRPVSRIRRARLLEDGRASAPT